MSTDTRARSEAHPQSRNSSTRVAGFMGRVSDFTAINYRKRRAFFMRFFIYTIYEIYSKNTASQK